MLVYRGMWWLVGLRSYRPYQLIIVLMHLGAAYLVRVIMRRVGVRPWTATVVACVLVFFGAGFKNIISLTLLLIVLLFFPNGLFGGFAKKA